MFIEAKYLTSLWLDSDGVLNPSGVRFGSGEVYTIFERFLGSKDNSLCVGQRPPQDKDEQVLFLKMRPGYKFTPWWQNFQQQGTWSSTYILRFLISQFVFHASCYATINILLPVHCEWQEDRNPC